MRSAMNERHVYGADWSKITEKNEPVPGYAGSGYFYGKGWRNFFYFP
ncbi:hypothetical protein [Paenibacillus sp. BK033]|nr:hypothetical protein [Paenibacillus sp. BK033]